MKVAAGWQDLRRAQQIAARRRPHEAPVERMQQCRQLMIGGKLAIDLGQCLQEVYLTDPGVGQGLIPNDPELPLPLDKVHPLHEVVKVDYFIPGCPPSGDAIWKFLTDLIEGRTPKLGHGLIHYD